MKKHKVEEVLIIVSGTGYKEAKRIFRKKGSFELIQVEGVDYKINVGAATAKLLVKAGAKVCMVARREDRLSNLKRYICDQTKCNPNDIFYRSVDLLDEKSVSAFVASLPEDRPIWLVHSVGLGSQAYSINGDNPYLPVEKTPADLVVKEFEVPVKSLLLLVQSLERIFQRQEESRIAVVTSMSGIRSYMYGYSHTSAKAGIHHAVRSLTLELGRRHKSVYVSEILPGIVDTGLYDSKEVIKSVQEIGETFGFFGERKYNEENFPLMSPLSVAEAIVLALQSDAHILSINMVAHGQFPNIGA